MPYSVMYKEIETGLLFFACIVEGFSLLLLKSQFSSNLFSGIMSKTNIDLRLQYILR
jgi:hypothetical protein